MAAFASKPSPCYDSGPYYNDIIISHIHVHALCMKRGPITNILSTQTVDGVSHIIHKQMVTCTISHYRSLPGKCLWALFYNSQYLHTWALTRDRKRILSYGSVFIHPCKIGTWALTWDTTVFMRLVPLHHLQCQLYCCSPRNRC